MTTTSRPAVPAGTTEPGDAADPSTAPPTVAATGPDGTAPAIARRAAMAADAVRTADGRPVRIAVVDYGMGNRRSVEKALEHAGASAVISADPDEIRGADGIVLCGVGAFPAGATRLRESGLGDLVRDRVADGVPLLGVCLGMQLLFDRSDERGGAEGLGLIPGPVRVLAPGVGLKLPHIGWNLVRWTAPPAADAGAHDAVRAGLPDRAAFYHVHSHVAHPDDPTTVIAHGDYGGPFVTAVGRGRVHGVQFHPEKSSLDGLRLLRSFAATSARCAT
ncbi:MAG: imidazole glycerol phosphate synthase subunit HisH [Solirubrobacteraceae bacterium]|nr:imidazole glycerol phosphate synthase subunit HisH [Solirubrobacteraceae bacterium]